MLDVLQAISEPTRFKILKMLGERELAAGEIAGFFPGVSRPSISQHIKVLKDNGLLWERRAGTKRLYRMRRKGLSDLYLSFEALWGTTVSDKATLSKAA